jgi:hypothetical protein
VEFLREVTNQSIECGLHLRIKNFLAKHGDKT